MRALASRIGSLARNCPKSIGSISPRPAVLHSVTRVTCHRQLRASGSGFSKRAYSRPVMASTASLEEQIKQKNQKYPVIVYAKSWCPYCGQVKGLFRKLGVDFQSVNLDEIHEGVEIQDELSRLTGVSTVPQVFVDGNFVGGCDDTMKKHNNGELKKLFEESGVASSY